MAAYETWIVEIAFASQPDSTNPTWVDVTRWVDTQASLLQVTRGQDSEDSQTQPARLVLVLNNADHRFTPGNTASPYYPNMKQARRIRVREVIGPRGFDIYSGWIEFPEILDWAESGDQTVTVSATDRLARLGRGRRLISVLGEHILYNGGTALKAYYPMGDVSAPFADVDGGNTSLQLYISDAGDPTAATGTSAVTYANTLIAPADDLLSVDYSIMTTGADSRGLLYGAHCDLAAPIALAAGQVLTAVVWLKPNRVASDAFDTLVLLTLTESPSGYQPYLELWGSSDGWHFYATSGSLGGFIDTLTDYAVDYGAASAVPVAIRFGYSPSVFELWVGSKVYTGVLAGAPPTSTTLTSIAAPTVGYSGSIGHLQVYVGAAADFTNAAFLAQMAMGWTGLAGQTAGQRVSTVAAYAGIAASELDVDPGVTPMPAASFAGRSPLDPMRDAEAAERGVLLAGPDGRLTFQGRTRRYNT